MNIAIDLDDVVLDFCGGLAAALNTEFDAGVSVDDFTQWNLRPFLDPIVGQNWWTWLRNRDWLWANFPAIPGALGAIEQLRREGHYVECITSKPEWAEYSVWKWLGKWRPPFNRVTIVNMDTPKWQVTNASILVDDKYDNCNAWVTAPDGRMPDDPQRVALLFNRPHNAGDLQGAYPQGIMRAFGWTDVLGMVRAYQNVEVDLGEHQ